MWVARAVSVRSDSDKGVKRGLGEGARGAMSTPKGRAQASDTAGSIGQRLPVGRSMVLETRGR